VQRGQLAELGAAGGDGAQRGCRRRRRRGWSGADGSAGVVTGESAAAVFEEVQQLMASHRVWERFPASVA